ncbi:MAG: type I-C CRISPR-associated protein Cas5c [Actinomycetota bacterium]|nr:type I-C CRISPR-associated protein Cas5c [Actinomycetota bacterium]
MSLIPPAGGPVGVRAWGSLACFTMPEFGVERVSYPTMTPTAAVGFLDAIYWKPEFRWRVVAIDTLKPVRHLQLRRNEITSRQTFEHATEWANGTDEGLDTADVRIRTQRATLALSDVAYVIWAHAEVLPGVDESHAKFRDQLRRRVERGQCFERPYLGCREFVADFGPPLDDDTAIEWTQDLGPMIHSVYAGGPDANISGVASPIFFDAKVRDGRLVVPPLPEGRR